MKEFRYTMEMNSKYCLFRWDSNVTNVGRSSWLNGNSLKNTCRRCVRQTAEEKRRSVKINRLGKWIFHFHSVQQFVLLCFGTTHQRNRQLLSQSIAAEAIFHCQTISPHFVVFFFSYSPIDIPSTNTTFKI